MKRKRRTEILIKGNRSLANRLKEEIESRYKVTVINEPSHGLVMIKTRETAKNTLFYLGETLVTEATVYVNGSIGLGIVQGDEPELAYNLAVIDGAYKLNAKETIGWKELLLKEEKEIEELYKIEKNKILETKVNFETMNV